MVLMILGIGFALLPLLLRLALKLRLGIPLVYSILMLTVFHVWYQAHAALADGILFAMVGIVALSWVVMSAPVIKCKKTPRKKCSLVAEVKGKR